MTTQMQTEPADSSGASSPLLEVRRAEVAYGDASTVLRGVSLVVPEGGTVAILGVNGAGKTTTIRTISGLLGVHRGALRSGDVLFAGQSIKDRRPEDIVALGIAQVPEGRMLFANLTVEENLRIGAASGRDPDPDAAMERVMELFPVLYERRRQQAGWMSGGEQQMIAIGRALMAAPRMLLIDELSLGLAPIITEKIVERLREARRMLGMATLLVEQNAMLALEFSDYAYIIENGKTVLEGPSRALMDDPQVQEAYLGLGQRDEALMDSEAPRENWWL